MGIGRVGGKDFIPTLSPEGSPVTSVMSVMSASSRESVGKSGEDDNMLQVKFGTKNERRIFVRASLIEIIRFSFDDQISFLNALAVCVVCVSMCVCV